MMKIRIREDLRCPRHPRFLPSQGQGAIRGGCIYCSMLFDIATHIRNTEMLVRTFRGVVQEEPCSPPPKS